DHCKLTPDALGGLLHALAENRRLRAGCALHADGNDLGAQGAAKLAPHMTALANVRKLSLRGCALGAEGLCRLLEGVSAGAPLEVLDVSCNVKGNAGRKALDALMKTLANLVQTCA